jgi:hypothetical protein
MNTAHKKLIRDTKNILAHLQAIGTDAAAACARKLVADTWKKLGSVDRIAAIKEFNA